MIASNIFSYEQSAEYIANSNLMLSFIDEMFAEENISKDFYVWLWKRIKMLSKHHGNNYTVWRFLLDQPAIPWNNFSKVNALTQ